MQTGWKYLVGIALAFVCSSMASAQEVEPVASSADETNRSLIPLIGIRYHLNERLDLSVHGSQVFGDLRGPLALARLRYMHSDMWGVGLGYFGFWQDGTAARPNPQDQRIRLEGYLSLPLGESWRVSHRSRAEYRFRDVEDGWRYRPNFRLQRSFDLSEAQSISPFVYMEPFYDFTESRITSVEHAIGVNVNVTDTLSLEAWAAHSEGRRSTVNFQYIGLIFTYRVN